LSGTVLARVSICAAVPIMPSESRNHCTSEPVMATAPSSAYTGVSPSR
jgi:hypothetical protein